MKEAAAKGVNVGMRVAQGRGEREREKGGRVSLRQHTNWPQSNPATPHFVWTNGNDSSFPLSLITILRYARERVCCFFFVVSLRNTTEKRAAEKTCDISVMDRKQRGTAYRCTRIHVTGRENLQENWS